MPEGPPQLTPRRRALIKNLSKGMSITDAARKAGYTTKHPGQAGHQALEGIRLKFPHLLDKHGLTDEALIEKYLKPLLKAKETKFFAFQGEVIETHDVEALGIRKEALDMTFRLKGSYAPTNIEHTGQIIHEITSLEREMAKESLQKIRALQSSSKHPLIAEIVDPAEEK